MYYITGAIHLREGEKERETYKADVNHPPTPPSPIRFPLSFIYRRWQQQAVCWPSSGQYGLDDVDMVPVRKYIYIFISSLLFFLHFGK
jgi:hypothetical protein